MGFSELLGIRLMLSREYRLEELYELIRDEQFDAGTPQLVHRSDGVWIGFPPLSDGSQVVIGGQNGKFYVRRGSQQSGGSLWEGEDADGGDKKHCEDLVRRTGEQLSRLHL